MLTLLSPSKTLDMDACTPVQIPTQPQFLSDTEELATTLKQYSPDQLKKLMGISDKLAELNHARYQSFSTPFTPDNAKQAILMFKGDVYDGLYVHDFTPEHFYFAQNHLNILSGFYGLLRPLDLLQPYRLEMGIKLSTNRGKNLYEFWGGNLTNALNEQLVDHKDTTLVNLASNEYAKAIQPDKLNGNFLQVDFKEYKQGEYKIIGLFAKKARGMMARYIITQNIDHADGLKEFNDGGYIYNPSLSEENHLVFTR